MIYYLEVYQEQSDVYGWCHYGNRDLIPTYIERAGDVPLNTAAGTSKSGLREATSL